MDVNMSSQSYIGDPPPGSLWNGGFVNTDQTRWVQRETWSGDSSDSPMPNSGSYTLPLDQPRPFVIELHDEVTLARVRQILEEMRTRATPFIQEMPREQDTAVAARPEGEEAGGEVDAEPLVREPCRKIEV